jgi:alkylation response protein AidB-like acyl-CoA dehydrogenase
MAQALGARGSEVVELDGAEILARARALAPEIRAAADGVEAERRIPEALLARLIEAGVFRIAMPRAWGGPEMDPLAQIELVEELARADASVAWVVMITSDSGFYSAWLDETVARAMYPSLDARTAGQLFPAGQAHVVPGGLRVSGHWAFGSGSLHADWLVGGCLLFEDGKPRIGPRGLPEWRVVYLPPAEVEILDTWRTTGLAGSGSHDYRAQDVFVPAERTFDVLSPPRRSGPLYGYHGLFFSNLPGVPLGLARAAVDEVTRLAREKRVPPLMALLRDEYRVQEAVAEAEGILQSARAFVFDVMGEAWRTLSAGDPLSGAQRARVGLMMVHSVRASRQVVQLMYDTAGSAAIYRRNPLDRQLRDMLTVSAHVVGQRKAYAMVGQVMLGLEPPFTYF